MKFIDGLESFCVHTFSAASVFTWQAPSHRPALSCHLFCLYDWFTMSYEASSPPSSVVRDQVSSYNKRLMVTQTALGVTGGNTYVRLSSVLWVQILHFSKIAWGRIYTGVHQRPGRVNSLTTASLWEMVWDRGMR